MITGQAKRTALVSFAAVFLAGVLIASAINEGNGRATANPSLRSSIPAPERPVTTKTVNFGASGRWSLADESTRSLRGIRATRAMDLIRIRADRSQPLVIEDVAADKVRHFLDIYDNKARPTVANLTVQRIRAGFTKRGIRLRYGSNGIVIRDFRLTHLGPNTSPGDIPVAIGLFDNVHNVRIERGVIENVLTRLSEEKRYWNADGISLERGVRDVVLRDLVIRNCTDGGIDSKASNVLIDRVSVEGCTRNLRLWEDTRIGSFESINPSKHGGTGGTTHIGLYQGVSHVTIGKLIVRSDKPVPLFLMESDAPATVVIESHDIRTPRGTPIIGGQFDKRLNVVWKSGAPRL